MAWHHVCVVLIFHYIHDVSINREKIHSRMMTVFFWGEAIVSWNRHENEYYFSVSTHSCDLNCCRMNLKTKGGIKET